MSMSYSTKGKWIGWLIGILIALAMAVKFNISPWGQFFLTIIFSASGMIIGSLFGGLLNHR